MLTYIVAIVAAVAILYGSFRALGGGGAPVEADDYRLVLTRLTEFTGERAVELRDALALPPAERPQRPGEDPMAEAAGAARKKLGAYLQQLSRLEARTDDEAEQGRFDAARSMLEAAVEDLGWACRMIEAGVYRDNPGIQRAVALLREHGEDCLAHAGAILGSPG